MTQLLMITGPAGSGKSTLASHVAKTLGWVCIEEDSYWVAAGFGEGLRTPEQENIIQSRVVDSILEHAKKGDNIVLEFILYKSPPNPLTAYQRTLGKHGVTQHIVALGPSVDEIVRRIETRGREHDLTDLAARRKDAKHQLSCLGESYIKPYVIDSTDMTVEELTRYCQNLVTGT